MNRIWWFLRGYWIVELTGASPEWALNRLTELRIPFWSVRWIDNFTVRVHLFPRDLPMAETIAEKSMCQYQILDEIGVRDLLRGIWKRPFLWISILIGFLIVLAVPKFVLFYEIEGNETISDAAILRELNALGIDFGTYGPDIKSQWVEDHMLNLVDGLERITINQSGCIAHVVVRERQATPKVTDRKGFTNIVASRAGVIEEQAVWTGQKLKEIGDVVTEGEMLVSGIVNLERTFLVTRAQAEIFARTWRNYEAITPQNYTKKENTGETRIGVWLECGKRRIKIFGNSGISTAACDKMIDRKILSLPGGKELPVSLLIETYEVVQYGNGPLDQDAAFTLLSALVEETALRQMTAGEVLHRRPVLSTEEGLFRVTDLLECREMIAETAEANWIEEE